jgi:hypothetical protein
MADFLAAARLWYPGRLSLDWRRRNAAETQAVFAAVGLTGAFRLLPSH